MKYVDSHGIPVEVGDTIIYYHSKTNGNTSLNKAIISSFTKSGRPRVWDVKSYWDTPDRKYTIGATIAYESYEKALTCNFAKGHKE